MVKRFDIDLNLTPVEVAQLFCKMGSDDMAIFFNQIAAITAKWDNSLCFQLQHLTDDKQLSNDARKVMEAIGAYAYTEPAIPTLHARAENAELRNALKCVAEWIDCGNHVDDNVASEVAKALGVDGCTNEPAPDALGEGEIIVYIHQNPYSIRHIRDYLVSTKNKANNRRLLGGFIAKEVNKQPTALSEVDQCPDVGDVFVMVSGVKDDGSWGTKNVELLRLYTK